MPVCLQDALHAQIFFTLKPLMSSNVLNQRNGRSAVEAAAAQTAHESIRRYVQERRLLITVTSAAC